MAALSAQSQLFGRTIVAGNDATEVALTFDDGPNERYTEELLEVLGLHGVRATFFMVGRHVRARPELARAVAAAGHLIGNHTETHPWLHLKPAAVIRRELGDCQAALEDILGAAGALLPPAARSAPPRGAAPRRRAGHANCAVELHGAGLAGHRPERIVAHVDRGLRRAQRQHRGANIVLHDGDGLRMGADRSDTIRATDMLLQRFRADGTAHGDRRRMGLSRTALRC